MAKLTRVTAKVFGENASLTIGSSGIGQFGSAKAGTFNITGDVATIQALPAWSTGFRDAVTASSRFPALEEMTGLAKVLSYQNAYVLQEGLPEWDAGTTYNIGSIVKVLDESNKVLLYQSIIDNNLNTPVTNTTAWKKVEMGGGASRNIGEIVTSTIPLTDAGLHLLDGALISGSGSYADFVDYIADLYNDNPTANYFAQPLLEQDWIQPVLSSNGVLGGNTFACSADSVYSDFYAYKALDGNTSTSWQSNDTTTSGTWFIFYNPIPIKVTQITWSGTPTYGTITGGVVYGSNDNSNYTQIGIFSNGTTTGGTIDLSTNTNFYKYYKITPTTWTDSSGTYTNGWAKLTITAKTQSKTAEQVWQDNMSQYGVCGKFVYDSVNNTVRLPKITGILEGTTDLTALGDLVEAGLPNIKTSSSVTRGLGISDDSSIDPPFYNMGNIGNEGSGAQITRGVGFDASLSNSIYGNSNTVQPQTILGLIYIVIATSTKTQIQVDIDEVMTDLNGKADVDLTNVNDSGTSRGAGWAMPSNTYTNLTLGASGATYTAPANGWITLSKDTSSANNKYIRIKNLSNGYAQTANTDTGGDTLAVSIPVLKNQIVEIYYTANGTTNVFRFIYAVGSESEA